MTPDTSGKDVADERVRDTELLGERAGWHQQSFCANGPNIFIGELAAMIGEACWIFLPTLREHVCDVLSLRTKKEMPWIAANPVIAAVAYNQPFRDFASVCHLPSDPMGRIGRAINFVDDAVAFTFRSGPWPALLSRAAMHTIFDHAFRRAILPAKAVAGLWYKYAARQTMIAADAFHSEASA